MAKNSLFTFANEAVQNEAATTAGERAYYFAEYNAQGTFVEGDLKLADKLRAGDTGPTPEAVTEDTTYDGGTVVSNQTGINFGTKSLEIEGSADDPLIAMLIDHSRVFGTPQKAGKLFAFEAFNLDRSCFYGSARVNTASAPRDGGHRWVFGIVFEKVDLRRPSQNPVPLDPNAPAGAMAPTTGLVGATVTVTGTKLDDVTSITFGAETIEAANFTTHTATEIAFAAPAVAAGDHAVAMVHPGGTVDLGNFTVTSA